MTVSGYRSDPERCRLRDLVRAEVAGPSGAADVRHPTSRLWRLFDPDCASMLVADGTLAYVARGGRVGPREVARAVGTAVEVTAQGRVLLYAHDVARVDPALTSAALAEEGVELRRRGGCPCRVGRGLAGGEDGPLCHECARPLARAGYCRDCTRALRARVLLAIAAEATVGGLLLGLAYLLRIGPRWPLGFVLPLGAIGLWNVGASVFSSMLALRLANAPPSR